MSKRSSPLRPYSVSSPSMPAIVLAPSSPTIMLARSLPRPAVGVVERGRKLRFSIPEGSVKLSFVYTQSTPPESVMVSTASA
jgi:hypothetical protein